MKYLSLFIVCSVSLFASASDKAMQAQPTQEEYHFAYGSCPKVTQLLDKEFYQQVVETLPILCIDICLVDLSANRYLVMKRTNKPAQDVFWFPGGRMLKGESFFEGAQRKCLEEIGTQVTMYNVIGIFNTIFPDSEWGTPTHTPIVTVLATCNGVTDIHLDKQHGEYKWMLLSEPNVVDYIEVVRKKVLSILRSNS